MDHVLTSCMWGSFFNSFFSKLPFKCYHIKAQGISHLLLLIWGTILATARRKMLFFFIFFFFNILKLSSLFLRVSFKGDVSVPAFLGNTCVAASLHLLLWATVEQGLPQIGFSRLNKPPKKACLYFSFFSLQITQWTEGDELQFSMSTVTILYLRRFYSNFNNIWVRYHLKTSKDNSKYVYDIVLVGTCSFCYVVATL